MALTYTPASQSIIRSNLSITSSNSRYSPSTGFERRTDLLAADFVPAAVDRIEQTLGQVGSRAEELHLLADQHRRHTAGDGAVVAPGAAHDLVAFELNRAGVDRHLCREIAGSRPAAAGEYQIVRFGSGAGPRL